MYSIVKETKHSFYNGKHETLQLVKTEDVKTYVETILKEWFSTLPNITEDFIQNKLNEIIKDDFGYWHTPNVGGREIQIENNLKLWSPDAHTN